MPTFKQWLYTTDAKPGCTSPGFPRPRWGVWVALGIVGLSTVAGLGYGGYRWSGGWIERRNAGRAREFIAQKDYRRALLLLEQAVQVNPDSVNARRVLAEFYDLAGNPGALNRWREAVGIAPADDSLKLAWAASALRFGQTKELRAALDQVAPATRETLPFHRLAAALALAEGKAEELATQLEAMTRLEPDNARSRYSLASLRLRSPKPEEAAAGRAELEALARGDEVRIVATLALWQSLPPADPNVLSPLAARLLPKGAFRPTADGAFVLIEHMKSQSRPSAEDAVVLANWMGMKGYARESLLWLNALEPATLANPAVQAARAAAAVRLQDWTLLSQLLIDGAWGQVGRDVIERAFTARRERAQSQASLARGTFGEALKLSTGSSSALWVLARLCAAWEWPEEGERVYWQLVRSFPADERAWRGLIAGAEASGSSEKVLSVLQQRSQARPADATARAEWLLLAVLGERADDGMIRRAREAMSTATALPAEIAAGALVWMREGRSREALAALARVGEGLRASARARLVYGALLAEAGRLEEAKLWLPAARARLLPEETALLTRAGVRPSQKG